MDRRTLLAIFGCALVLRVALVAWSPGLPFADGLAYTQYARRIDAGMGYVNIDGSAAIRWMPGWPYLLSVLYGVFGATPRVGMWANAIFDSATPVMLAGLGARLVSRRVGATAGFLYALWPGMVYYSATLFCEPLFNLLLVTGLGLVVRAGAAMRRREAWFAAAGLVLGLAALVKAEPLILTPVICVYVWRVSHTPAQWIRSLAAMALVVAVLLAPWVLRNQRAFGRFIPTSGSGGIGAHLSFHPGASGGQDYLYNRALAKKYKRASIAETTLARNDAGFRDAWGFVVSRPAEALQIVVSKLRITYRGDSQGARTIRGRGNWISPDALRRLSALADAYWFAMLALAAVGLVTTPSWRPGAAILVVGLLVTWFGLHVLMLGGQRYHVPEIPVLALLAAAGLQALVAWARRLRRREVWGGARAEGPDQGAAALERCVN